MSGVQPFQFEPTYPDDSEEASGESDSELDLNRRIRPGQGFWVYGILDGFYEVIRYFLPTYGYKVFCFS